MSAVDLIARQLARVPSVRSETAVFVRMDAGFAVVNIGESTVSLPCQGWYPPIPGMTVQVEWRAGRGIVTGPAGTLSPIGEITGTGSPRATVLVDGVEYLLYLRDGYTAVLGDQVTVDWSAGIITGKVTGVDTPEPPVEPGGPTAQPFADLGVRAWKSGRFESSWWGTDPWASSSNDGIWVYGSRIVDALKGADVTRVFIYLPLIQQLGNCSIGLHTYGDIPGGAPSIGSLVALPLGGRSGWVELPAAWGNFLRDNVGGIGVTAPGGGFNKWTSVNLQPLSGALSFSGTR